MPVALVSSTWHLGALGKWDESPFLLLLAHQLGPSWLSASVRGGNLPFPLALTPSAKLIRLGAHASVRLQPSL